MNDRFDQELQQQRRTIHQKKWFSSQKKSVFHSKSNVLAFQCQWKPREGSPDRTGQAPARQIPEFPYLSLFVSNNQQITASCTNVNAGTALATR